MRGGEAALDVLDLHQPERANLPVAHQARREAGHRVRRVAVGDCEQPSGRADAGDEVARLGGIVRHRLVGDDVEARVEGRDGKRVVRVVGGHDGHAVDAVGPVPFRRDHPRDIAVAPVGGHAHRGTGGARTGGVAREYARDDVPPPVQLRGPLVHPPDPRIRPAPDHPEPQSPSEPRAQIAHRRLLALPEVPAVTSRVCRVAYRSGAGGGASVPAEPLQARGRTEPVPTPRARASANSVTRATRPRGSRPAARGSGA